MPRETKYEPLLLGACVVLALVLWRSCSSSAPQGVPKVDVPVQQNGSDATEVPQASSSISDSPVAPAETMPEPRTNSVELHSTKDRSGIPSEVSVAPIDSAKATRNAPVPELPSTPSREPVALENVKVPQVDGTSAVNPKNATYPNKPPEKPLDNVTWKERPLQNTSAASSQNLRIPDPPTRR